MSLPLILQPGEGRSVQIRTSTCTFKATGKETELLSNLDGAAKSPLP
jgi:hypothetical protein